MDGEAPLLWSMRPMSQKRCLSKVTKTQRRSALVNRGHIRCGPVCFNNTKDFTSSLARSHTSTPYSTKLTVVKYITTSQETFKTIWWTDYCRCCLIVFQATNPYNGFPWTMDLRNWTMTTILSVALRSTQKKKRHLEIYIIAKFRQSIVMESNCLCSSLIPI